MNFKKNTKPQDLEKQQKRADGLKSLHALFESRERVLEAFKRKKFPIKIKSSGYLDFKPSNLKILTPKQMLQRLLIAFGQIEAGNNSKRLLNEIREIVSLLFISIKRNYQKSI